MTLGLRLLPVLMLALGAGCRDAPQEAAASDDRAVSNAAPAGSDGTDAPDSGADNGAAIDNGAGQAAALPPGRAASATRSLDLPASNETEADERFPGEVTAFMVDRDGCDHFRGEEPYDAERRVYLEESIAALCTGSDARLALLRRRYAGDATVMAALSGYEDRIETPAAKRRGPDEDEDDELF
ncbi:MAG: hypothetical protein ABW039_03595 [Sphingobium sp.]